MKNQLAAFSLLLAGILLMGLLALAGSIILAAAPLLLYIVGAALFRQPEPQLVVERELTAHRVVPSTPVEVTVTVHNRGSAIPEVRIADRVPPGLRVIGGSPEACLMLRHGARHSFSYTVTSDRGSVEFDVTDIEVAGAFPLRSLVREYHNPGELVTLPSHKALSRIPIAPRRTLVFAGSLPARRGGEGTEFFDVRAHSDTGATRRVNWRLSARRPDEVYVNEFQEERVADIGIILDARRRVYPQADGPSLFEAAASAAASMADVMLDGGNRVGFLAYGISIDWTAPGFGRAQKQRVLTRIAKVYPGDSYVFQKLDQVPERLLPGGSQIILVSPLTAEDAPSVMRLAAYGYAVMVISPNAIAGQVESMTGRSGALAARVARAERNVLIHRLRRTGIPVVDWDPRVPLEAAVSGSIGQIRAAWRHRSR